MARLLSRMRLLLGSMLERQIMPAGRPTDYTPELAALICERIASGLSMRTVCKADDIPNAATVFLWIQRHKEFAEQYALATAARAHAHAEDTIDIADDASNDWMETHDPDNPGYKLNGEHINRSRLRVDTRKWFASKCFPKKYGEKVQTELTGAEGKDLIPEVSDLELARRVAFLFAQAKKSIEDKS